VASGCQWCLRGRGVSLSRAGDTRLLALHGMVQIFYSGSAYWTPLCIFLPQSYPEFPPIV